MKGLFTRGLWTNANFMRLWGGESISMIGSQITLLALPLTAVLVLHATPGEMGGLAALEYAPFLLFGLVAGAWVDRLQPRRVMIVADVARCIVLVLIPVFAAVHALWIGELYIVAFAAGVGTAFFDVAYLAFVPVVVGREQLLDANAKFEGSRAFAGIVGPGAAGPLVQLLTAPVVLLVDAASFLASAFFLVLVRRHRDDRSRNAQQTSILREVVSTLGTVARHPVLRALGGCVGTFNLFSSMAVAIYVLYVTTVLGVTPALLGLITAVGGIGALAGTTFVVYAGRRASSGRVITGAILLSALGTATIAAARGTSVLVTVVLTVAQAVVELGVTATVVKVVSLRQAMTPIGEEGRISATMRFLIYGTVPLGALLGGFLGQALGLRTTVLVAAVGESLAPLWIVLSPVWTM
ncbi:MAG TPA: MFS transporter [Candidatus Dormibacteraeota bacterium]